jgi:YebC/PmpR family DNA-binding regulatory protein
MSGHSKWSQIKRQKGASDVKRGVAFSKLANTISLAARGGADPAMNFQLRIAIDKARAANMPKDNIDRAIARVSGGAGQSALEEIIFEVYGPAGTAFLIEGATDNRNRTVSEVKSVLNKYGLKLAESGAVSYLFEKKGLIVVGVTEPALAEEAEFAAIDAGADDISAGDNQVFIYTKPAELESIRHQLAEHGWVIEEFSLVQEPAAPITIEDAEIAQKLIKLSQALEDLADVTKVESNFDIPDRLVVE